MKITARKFESVKWKNFNHDHLRLVGLYNAQCDGPFDINFPKTLKRKYQIHFTLFQKLAHGKRKTRQKFTAQNHFNTNFGWKIL